MPISELLAQVSSHDIIQDNLGRRHCDIQMAEAALPMVLAAISRSSERSPFIVVTPTAQQAERLCDDLQTWLGEDRAALFPAWETLPFERVSPNIKTMGRRLELLWRIRHNNAPSVVVVPVRSLLQKLTSTGLQAEPIKIEVGKPVDAEALQKQLVEWGYSRTHQAEHRGEFAVRGSIIDIFTSTCSLPVRIDLWGDEIDRFSEYDPGDQLSSAAITQTLIFPAREFLPDAYVADKAATLAKSAPWGIEQWQRFQNREFFSGMESWQAFFEQETTVLGDLIGPDAHIILCESDRLAQRATDLISEEDDLAASLAKTWGAGELIGKSPLRIHVGMNEAFANAKVPIWTTASFASTRSFHDGKTRERRNEESSLQANSWDRSIGEKSGPINQLKQLCKEGYSVVIAADTEVSARRLSQMLPKHDIPAELDLKASFVSRSQVSVIHAPLLYGAIFPEIRLAILAEPTLTGRRRAHRRRKPRATASSGFDDLKPGSYIVHRQHGIGRFTGMETRAISGVSRDYLVLEYRDNAKVYLPSDRVDSIRHYTGGDSPKLSKMGGVEWQKAKTKVKAAVAEVAEELVELYKKRVATPGIAFGADTMWQTELEDAFEFTETPDQLTAIKEVKADMEREVPMDRLICGDVGFGKTEVAVRAAFKAIQDQKQVAVLVPTTLLAQQHHQTFSERFAPYPIRVEVLSRFLTNKQAKDVTRDLAEKKVDVIVGTHRLLSKDIRIPNLGLLVVDEEQRFGVKHKEQIKSMKSNVDVLTLSATPIPRTLEMSLTGIRDLTLLHTPPAQRQPILTYVGASDERAVAEAIRRELLREGQVFFVHNRVKDIDLVADSIRELVPEARVAVAHGQMDEGSLEQIVYDFWDRHYDVLVCTTIIESGIDMPSVNTLVVNDAHRLGLGQLHQLRGRVGRSGQRAYAYLFYPQDMELSETAYERLKTVGEATELGSGFKIAMRDLEIRGAGNLVGTGQSGHIAAVGYDLYCQLVTEAVALLKNEPVENAPEVTVELPVSGSIPPEYMPHETQRLMAYRRLSTAESFEEVDEIETQWRDRFGDAPEPVVNLLDVARLRVAAVLVGITDVGAKVNRGALGGPKAVMKLSPVELKASKEMRLRRAYKNSWYDASSKTLFLAVSSINDGAKETVEALRSLGVLEADPQTAPEADKPASGSKKTLKSGDTKLQPQRSIRAKKPASNTRARKTNSVSANGTGRSERLEQRAEARRKARKKRR